MLTWLAFIHPFYINFGVCRQPSAEEDVWQGSPGWPSLHRRLHHPSPSVPLGPHWELPRLHGPVHQVTYGDTDIIYKVSTTLQFGSVQLDQDYLIILDLVRDKLHCSKLEIAIMFVYVFAPFSNSAGTSLLICRRMLWVRSPSWRSSPTMAGCLAAPWNDMCPAMSLTSSD